MSGLNQQEINKLWSSFKLNDQSLISATVVDFQNKSVLMQAWMNKEAFTKTIETEKATYFSRSRNKLWVKGEESGNIQLVKEIRLDCDADSLLLYVEQKGVACHTGNLTCFDEKIIWKKD